MVISYCKIRFFVFPALTEAFALLDRDDHGKIHYRELGVVLKSIGLHADDVQLKAMIKECAGSRSVESKSKWDKI